MLTRRRFLALAGGAAATASIQSTALIKSAFADTAAFPTKAQFAQMLGQVFRLYQTPSKVLVVTLKSVTDAPLRGTKPMTGEAYTLAFEGTGTPIPPGTYTFQQNRIGNVLLFVSSSSASAGVSRYVAEVNRRLPVN